MTRGWDIARVVRKGSDPFGLRFGFRWVSPIMENCLQRANDVPTLRSLPPIDFHGTPT